MYLHNSFVLDCQILCIVLVINNTMRMSHPKIMKVPISVSFTYSSTRRHMLTDDSKTTPLRAPRTLLLVVACLKILITHHKPCTDSLDYNTQFSTLYVSDVPNVKFRSFYGVLPATSKRSVLS